MPSQEDAKPMVGTKVLVIDDEHMIRWSVAQTLRTAGHEVLLAETAAEGLALFREFQPVVVFLDVRLPDMNGLTLLKRIKDDGAQRAAVIVMTAYEESCSVAEAMRLGAYACLRKPFDFDQLEGLAGAAVKQVLGTCQRCG